MPKFTGFIINAGHLDIEWYQPLHSYRFWTVEALQEFKNAAKRADYKCYILDGQTFPLEEYLEVHPEDKEEMREYIKEGKLAIGPFYTQFDEWLPSAENIIRNCIFGRRYCNNFGGYMKAGYLPDNFGHPFQIPQILQNFGIDSLLFMRGMPEIQGGHPDEFIYEGLDGSRVLAIHFREGYNGAFDMYNKAIDPIQPREVPYYADYLSYEWHRELADHDDPERIAKSLITNAKKMAHRFPSTIIPLVAGGDHLPPQTNIGDSIRYANNMQDEIEFIMGTPEDYVKLVRSKMETPPVYKMELIGSKYQYLLMGALSTRSYLKKQNFACEALLEKYAEPITALAFMHGYQDNASLLHEAWRYLLINSAHDSIHGSSVDETHIDMESRFGASRQIAAGVIHDAMAYMGKRIARNRSAENERSVLVYTPVSAAAAQPVEVYLPISDESICIISQDGSALPTQVIKREKAELNGIGMPRNDLFPHPVYRKVLFLAPLAKDAVSVYTAVKTSSSPDIALMGDDTYIENAYLKIYTANGLLSIYDKQADKHYYNLNMLEEEADAGDAWDYSPPWLLGQLNRTSSVEFSSSLTKIGAVAASIEQKGIMRVPVCLNGDERSADTVPMPITFTITLFSNRKRLDVKLQLDNKACDHRVRLRIPMNVKASSIRSQGHLAVIDRPVSRQVEIEPWKQPPTQLLPFREWLAAEDEKNGLAVAFKGLYDYEAINDPLTNKPDVFVTLLRSFEMMGRINTVQRDGAASEAFRTRGAQCQGIQTFEWSYIPYEVKAMHETTFIEEAQAFLFPPLSHAIRSKAEKNTPAAFHKPFTWKEKNIQLSAFKRAHDLDGFVLRLYENQGVETDIRLELNGFCRAFESNMNEDTLSEMAIDVETLQLHFDPYKVITIKLQ